MLPNYCYSAKMFKMSRPHISRTPVLGPRYRRRRREHPSITLVALPVVYNEITKVI